MCKQKASETRKLIFIQIKLKPGLTLKFKYFTKAISFLPFILYLYFSGSWQIIATHHKVYMQGEKGLCLNFSIPYLLEHNF